MVSCISGLRGHFKGKKIVYRSLRRASADPQRPFRSLLRSLASPRAPTQAGFKAVQHWNLTQRPFYGSPFHGACARLCLGLCRVMPRPCISAEVCQRIAAPVTARNFHPVEISASQARSRMHCHEGMHLLEQGSDQP